MATKQLVLKEALLVALVALQLLAPPSLAAPQKHQPGACQNFKLPTDRGYKIDEHKVTTADGYELTLHHVSLANGQTSGKPAGKPYLLLHGLTGSSASFLRNLQPSDVAPPASFDLGQNVASQLDSARVAVAVDSYAKWSSTISQTRTLDDKLKSASLLDRLMKVPIEEPDVAHLMPVNMNQDTDKFGPEFQRSQTAYKLPFNSLKQHLSNSMAFTLANFGYDVWLANFRGNAFARNFKGRFSSHHEEYWQFGIQQLYKQDLPAMINYIRKQSQHHTIGVVSYSYSSHYLLGLLSSTPYYQNLLKPVVLIAPAPLSAQSGSYVQRKLLKGLSDLMVPHNGPFPSTEKDMLLVRAVCHVPLLKRLCNFFQTIINGSQPKASVQGIIFSERESVLMQEDNKCGRTSTRNIHQQVEILSSPNMLPEFKPADAIKQAGEQVKRNVILMHSMDDSISTQTDIERIRESSLNNMVLTDYAIDKPDFGHPSFLFSKDAKMLVNAELVRMLGVFDHLTRTSQHGSEQQQQPRTGAATAAPIARPRAPAAPEIPRAPVAPAVPVSPKAPAEPRTPIDGVVAAIPAVPAMPAIPGSPRARSSTSDSMSLRDTNSYLSAFATS